MFGVGGAGGNAVNNMIEKHLEGVEFVVANTDAQALQQNQSASRIQLGVKVTEGLGAGARAEEGPQPKKALNKSWIIWQGRICALSLLVWAGAQAQVPRRSSHKPRVKWVS